MGPTLMVLRPGYPAGAQGRMVNGTAVMAHDEREAAAVEPAGQASPPEASPATSGSKSRAGSAARLAKQRTTRQAKDTAIDVVDEAASSIEHVIGPA